MSKAIKRKIENAEADVAIKRARKTAAEEDLTTAEEELHEARAAEMKHAEVQQKRKLAAEKRKADEAERKRRATRERAFDALVASGIAVDLQTRTSLVAYSGAAPLALEAAPAPAPVLPGPPVPQRVVRRPSAPAPVPQRVVRRPSAPAPVPDTDVDMGLAILFADYHGIPRDSGAFARLQALHITFEHCGSVPTVPVAPDVCCPVCTNPFDPLASLNPSAPETVRSILTHCNHAYHVTCLVSQFASVGKCAICQQEYVPQVVEAFATAAHLAAANDPRQQVQFSDQ